MERGSRRVNRWSQVFFNFPIATATEYCCKYSILHFMEKAKHIKFNGKRKQAQANERERERKTNPKNHEE